MKTILSFLIFFSALVLAQEAPLRLVPTGMPVAKAVEAEFVQTSLAGDKKQRFEIRLTIQPGAYLYFMPERFFKLTEEQTGLTDIGSVFPSAKDKKDIDGSMVKVYEGNKTIVIEKKVTDTDWTWRGSLTYQACSGMVCFPPETVKSSFSSGSVSSGESLENTASRTDNDFTAVAAGFETLKKDFGYKDAEEFLAFLSADNTEDMFAGKGIWLIMLLILAGGLALNLTPCVLPMIPVNIAVIGAGSAASSKAKGLLNGSVYGAGIALTYGLLGVAAVIGGATFGSINSSPWFNFGIAVIFILMALAMFDVITVDFTSLRSSGGAGRSSKSTLLIFSLGILSALLAGACVAPVVISVLLFSADLYIGGNVFGLALPFLLGAGMALPWPLMGMGLSFLPKPGRWMNWVKYAFGAVIAVMALYYALEGYNLIRSRVTGLDEAGKRTAVIEDIEVYTLLETMKKSKVSGRPILVDFTASWCKNCLVMDRTTFKDEKVLAALEDYEFVKFHAEDPSDPAIKEVLDHYDISGLPSFLVLKNNK